MPELSSDPIFQAPKPELPKLLGPSEDIYKLPEEQKIIAPSINDLDDSEIANIAQSDFEASLYQTKPKSVGEQVMLEKGKNMFEGSKIFGGDPTYKYQNQALLLDSWKLSNISRKQQSIPYGAELDPLQKEQWDQQMTEMNNHISSINGKKDDEWNMYDIVSTKGLSQSYLQRLAHLDSTWTGEYVQLRPSPTFDDQGRHIMDNNKKPWWQGYNSPKKIPQEQQLEPVVVTAISNKSKKSYQNDDGTLKPELADFYKKHESTTEFGLSAQGAEDLKKGLKISPEDEAAIDKTDKFNSVFLSDKRYAGVVNYLRLNPQVMNAVKDNIGKLTSMDLAWSGPDGHQLAMMKVLSSSIDQVYHTNKPVESILDPQKDPPIGAYQMAFKADKDFNEWTTDFERRQRNIVASSLLKGQSLLRESGHGDLFDRLYELQAQYTKNPNSLTPDERQEYAETYSNIMALNETQLGDRELHKDLSMYESNVEDYQRQWQKHTEDVKILGDEPGIRLLNFIAQQGKGYEQLQRLSAHFPELKKSQNFQEDLDKNEDLRKSLGMDQFSTAGLNFFKSAGIMINNVSGWAARQGEVPASDIGRIQNKLGWFDYAVPNREPGSFAEFTDGIAKGLGGMAPFIAAAALTRGQSLIALPETAPALAKFFAAPLSAEGFLMFTSASENYYSGAISAGLTPEQARIRAMFGGMAETMIMSSLPKMMMPDHGLVARETEALFSKGLTESSVLEFFGKFANKSNVIYRNVIESLKGAGLMQIAHMAGEAGNRLTNAIVGDKKYEEHSMFDVNGTLQNLAVMGIMSSIGGAMSKSENKTASMNEFSRLALENPVQLRELLDNMQTQSLANGRINPADVHEIWGYVGRLMNTNFPEGLTVAQRVSVHQINEAIKVKQDLMQRSDPSFKSGIEAEIKTLQTERDQYINSAAKAEKNVVDTGSELRKEVEEKGFTIFKPEKTKEYAKDNEAKAIQTEGGQAKEGAVLKIEEGAEKPSALTSEAKAEIAAKLELETERTTDPAELELIKTKKKYLEEHGKDIDAEIQELKDKRELVIKCPKINLSLGSLGK